MNSYLNSRLDGKHIIFTAKWQERTTQEVALSTIGSHSLFTSKQSLVVALPFFFQSFCHWISNRSLFAFAVLSVVVQIARSDSTMDSCCSAPGPSSGPRDRTRLSSLAKHICRTDSQFRSPPRLCLLPHFSIHWTISMPTGGTSRSIVVAQCITVWRSRIKTRPMMLIIDSATAEIALTNSRDSIAVTTT